MKTTTFEIEVSCSSENAEEQLTTIIAQLLRVSGIQSVNRVSSVASHKLFVRVAFSDANEAKSIHARIMSKIRAAKQFQVRGITTNLSDVFS